jgi:hypothetical protein
VARPHPALPVPATLTSPPGNLNSITAPGIEANQRRGRNITITPMMSADLADGRCSVGAGQQPVAQCREVRSAQVNQQIHARGH